MVDSAGLEALFIHLYFDRHIMNRLATDLRCRGFDVLRTEETDHDFATDVEQLSFSTREGRAIPTYNIRDFAPLYDHWLESGRTHGGIIVSQQYGSRQYSTLLQQMLRLLNRLTSEEMVNNFVHLEQFK